MKSTAEDDFEFQLQVTDVMYDFCVREYKFHPTRKWRFDFAYPDFKVAVEVEGLVYQGAGGRHQRARGYEADLEKYNEAAILGWTVIRVSPKHISTGRAIDWTKKALGL